MDIASLEVLDSVSAFLEEQIHKSKEMDDEQVKVWNRVGDTLGKLQELEGCAKEVEHEKENTMKTVEIQTDISEVDDRRTKRQLFSRQGDEPCSMSTQTEITFPKMWDAKTMAKSICDDLYIRLKAYLEEAFKTEKIKIELPNWIKLEQLENINNVKASVEDAYPPSRKSSEDQTLNQSEYIAEIDTMIPPVPSLSHNWNSILVSKPSDSLTKKLEELEKDVKASKEFRISWQNSKFSRLSPYKKPSYFPEEISS